MSSHPYEKNSLLDLTKVVTLVNDGDTSNKIIIKSSSVERFKRGEATVLSLESHPGMALSYFPSSKHKIVEPLVILFILGVRKEEHNCTKWKYEGKSKICTSLYEKSLNRNIDFNISVSHEIIGERRDIFLAHLNADWYRGSSFQINDNGSISIKENNKLFLGIRGNIKEENLHDAILLRCGNEKIKSLAEEVNDVNVLVSGKSALANASAVCDIDTTRMLINEFNALPNHEDEEDSPLRMATSFGHKEILKILLDAGADRNAVNCHNNTSLFYAVLFKEWDCMTMLLDDDETDVNLGPNYPLSLAIKKNQYDYVEYLLKYGASLNCTDEKGKCTIQQACSKGNINGLPSLTLLVKYRGDLSKDRVINMRDDEKKVFFQVYARLSVRDLARCGARCFLKGENSKNFNPFLECTKLSDDVKQCYLKDQKFDSTSADEFQKLFIKLQLVSTCFLKEIYTVKSKENWEHLKGESPKEENRSKFLAEEVSKEALDLAHKSHSRCLFAQPILSNHFAQTWYGELMYDIFGGSNNSNMIIFLGQLYFVLILLIIQTPVLPFLGLLPKNIFAQLRKIDLPEFMVKPFSLKKRKAFIIVEPVSLFLVQCITDLTLAIIFYQIDGDSLVSFSMSPHFLLLLYALAGAFAMELKDLLSFKDLRSYFVVDHFNFFDLPGLSLATLTLLIPLIFQDNVELIVLKSFLSFANVFLWLRVLRILCLYSGTAHLTIIFFKMLRSMVEWLVLLLIIVLAFGMGISNMHIVNDDSWSYLGQFSVFDYFEDVMSPGNQLFNVTKGGNLNRTCESLIVILIYLFILVCHVLMINMLIAMMTEAFSSVWDARASNFTFQRVTHCLDMQKKQNAPIQVMYLPFAIYSVMAWLVIEMKNIMKKSHDISDTMKTLEPSTKTKYSSFDENREDELTNIFEEYITSHQDEASEEDCWRVTLAKKSTQVTKHVESLEQEVRQDMESLKQGMKKEMEYNNKEMESLKQEVKQEVESNTTEIGLLKKEMREEMESLKQMFNVLLNEKTY